MSEKIHNKKRGDKGEKMALKFLKEKGYRLLHKNFTTDIGELDLVVTDDITLVFVEVKSRSSDDFGLPSEAVTYHKRNKINQVASQYIKKFRLMGIACRFDVVEIYLSEGRINHIENAFDSYLHY